MTDKTYPVLGAKHTRQSDLEFLKKFPPGYYAGCAKLDNEIEEASEKVILKFGEVKPGDYFVYNGGMWMKLDPHWGRNPVTCARMVFTKEEYVLRYTRPKGAKDSDFVLEMEKLFGTDEAVGLYFIVPGNRIREKWTAAEYDTAVTAGTLSPSDEAVSFLSNGGSGLECTQYARLIWEKLGADRVKIYGFANKDNPYAGIVKMGLHPGGHDFAVVDDRYIVDPWPRLVKNAFSRIVFDMHDDNERHLALALYGDRPLWKRMLEAEN